MLKSPKEEEISIQGLDLVKTCRISPLGAGSRRSRCWMPGCRWTPLPELPKYPGQEKYLNIFSHSLLYIIERAKGQGEKQTKLPLNTMLKTPHHIFPHLSFFLLFIFTRTCNSHQQIYIVYLGGHNDTKALHEIHEHHHSLLHYVKNSEEEARESLLYSYKHIINGFAAFLSEDEATKISEMEEVISAFPSQKIYSLHTTRSWEFIETAEGPRNTLWENLMPKKAKYGKDVIVGMLDSGIWPESKSFDDKGMGPIPKRWKGICEEGDSFNSSSCNNKLIGARYYLKAYEAIHGPLNRTSSYRSPRDGDGHGTHTASTVAGRTVPGVSSLGGFARGTASGGAPLARLAIYKVHCNLSLSVSGFVNVCWPIPGPNPNLENTCLSVDMLAAFDDAVADGVDIISMSIGANGDPPMFSEDLMAIGALHAEERGVVVVCSGGNSGPGPSTVVNLAPWMITVGASSIDRGFGNAVMLGSGKRIEGQTVTPYTLKKKMYPLVYAGDVEVPGTPSNVTGQCLPNSLSPRKAYKKVVLCFRGAGFRAAKGMEVKRAGGAAIILGNSLAGGNEVPVDAHVLPGTGVSSDDAIAVLTYISSTKKPMVSIGKARTMLGIRPAPVMTAFSSRGPSRVEPNILKPDVTAPGLNILAAWSESSPPTKLDGDPRRLKYNLMSGTSMACPHVSATAALLKSLHPDWSPAAIRSAIMTTATKRNSQGGPITTAAGGVAGPMDYGSGHIRPSHAGDPGLVYDAAYEDYLLFICSSINAQLDPSFPCPRNPPSPSNLNYPSLAVNGLNGTVKVYRTVTNVSPKKARYEVSLCEPKGVRVGISPKILSFVEVGEKKSFEITLTAEAKGTAGYVAGSYTWSDGVHNVTSPIVVSLV